MPAQNDLLIPTVAADFMKNDGVEFCMDAGTTPPAYWRAIPQRNLLQLCQHGDLCLTRPLEPRLMQLLCLLANAEGAVLTRESLMEALWPRVIVNENSLTRAVSELRKALALPDDAILDPANSATGSGLIETVPKRGYRLNTRLMPEFVVRDTGSKVAGLKPESRTFFWQPKLRYPAIAAAMVISAALSSLWTLQLTDTEQSGQHPMMSQTTLQVPSTSAPHRLEDRVLSDTPDIPEGLHWFESVHSSFDNLNGLHQPWISAGDSSRISNSVIAPGGQMLAFVEEVPGRSQLRLRSLVNPHEAWTVFTTSSPITHLQWSPLDAGLLFTVEDKDGVATTAIPDSLTDDLRSSARLARLMLLDLETLQIRELYRRMMPAGDSEMRTVGSLT
ncbi:MAG: winged helix-turn-helix domain-containing protein [Pseudohongiella sp.]|nr:winged helix-turn-helix domain-containing protein [Pseudohongiella sp.]